MMKSTTDNFNSNKIFAKKKKKKNHVSGNKFSSKGF